VRASTLFRMPATSDRADRGPLARVRRALLALALTGCVLATIAIAGMPDRTPGLRLAGVVAVGSLALVWLRTARRGALSPFDEPIEVLALFTIGLAAGAAPVLAVVYPGLYLRSLYVSRVRAALGLVLYASAYAAAAGAGGGNGLREVLEQLPALALGCAVTQAFALMLSRHERSLSRERTLRQAGVALAEAPDRAAVYDVILDAVGRLGADQAAVMALMPSERGSSARGPTVRAAAGPWLPGLVGTLLPTADLPRDLAAGRTVSVQSPRLVGLELYAPPELGPGVCLPLAVRGESRGFLAVFGPGSAGTDHAESLAALAGEAALALAAADAADAAAVDRSLTRLTSAASAE
jgi:hypothetical protein